MVDFQCDKGNAVENLRKLIALLRSPEGCPWDKEQSHASIRRNFIEEVYEACEAIDTGDVALLQEELGDVLTQVIFHAQIEEELGNFTLDDVARETCRKLVSRHPHIFADQTAKDATEVMSHWEDIKRKEKGQATVTESMQAIAKSLPATWRAEKVQAKAAKVGFDFPTLNAALEKLQEEVSETKVALTLSKSELQAELGDVLFAAINLARIADIDPETALNQSTDKFTKRFAYLETQIRNKGQKIESLSLDEMETIYQESKQEL